MWFYHEGYRDAVLAEAVLEDPRLRDRHDDDQAWEPIPTPAILNWLGIVGTALCLIAALIGVLS
jgi:hypothetical protein